MTAERYPFASSDAERRRLVAQAELFAPLTRRLLERAGIGPRMRVLDIGSGAGDVALTAAELVGPGGSVIGVDRDPDQVAFAERRAVAAGFGHTRFLVADYRALELEGPVDAIVGRLVLMYATDPLDSLVRVLRHLRRGGTIALQESIVDYEGPVLIEPPGCLAAKACEWFRAGFRHSGVQPRMGLRLFGLLRAAGLEPSPDLDVLLPIQHGPGGALFRILAAVVRSQLPSIVASGAATEAEIDIDTLEARLIADAPPGGVAGYFHLGHVGAWARKP
ncbi:MAG TPA: methyltransferase domain-containing protein [Casimicrobiaceae bacterium]|nr:methyltransferase domain-containing protein [Casimicrobiaceae bacterium]